MPPKIAVVAGIALATALGIASVFLRQEPPPSASAFAIPADDPQLGRRVYARCQGCHGIDGRGIAGNYPPLAGSPLLTAADPTAAITLVLRGATRRQLNGEMPGFADLADHEIAGVLTWTRGQWGNAAPPVDPEAIAPLRRR